MRYAVLADVHANLHALEAVLAHAGPVDGHLVAGDLVGYGPFPNECVSRLAEIGAICVAGNHDLMVRGDLDATRCIPLGRTSVAWTRRVLRDDVRAYLAALPGRLDVDGSIVVAHGSLDDPCEYTARPEQAVDQLERLPARSGLLVLGHTHRAWACDGAGRVLRDGGTGGLPLPDRVVLNPGAVGQSRELRVRARYIELDTERRHAIFHAVPYDTRAVRAALRRRGLAPGSYHLRPGPRGIARRLLRAGLDGPTGR
ncbi:MAG TPA: metallophosphoesterase family protein [Solirubrobacteraceae bacterium]|nr:metallophosphoesterase family protein [Solirubrobacteraceae bacterium]